MKFLVVTPPSIYQIPTHGDLLVSLELDIILFLCLIKMISLCTREDKKSCRGVWFHVLNIHRPNWTLYQPSNRFVFQRGVWHTWPYICFIKYNIPEEIYSTFKPGWVVTGVVDKWLFRSYSCENYLLVR